MRWLGTSTKQTFVEWVNKATETELRKYVIERRYPKGKRYAKQTILTILELLLIYGSMGVVSYFAIDNQQLQIYKTQYTALDNLSDNLGSEICKLEKLGDYVYGQYSAGGFISIIYCEKGTKNYNWR
jgi:hypothetical protein